MFKELRVVLEILATILTIVSFCLISENVFLVGFGLAAISQIVWIIWAFMEKPIWGIIVVNSCLLLASVNGFWGAIS